MILYISPLEGFRLWLIWYQYTTRGIFMTMGCVEGLGFKDQGADLMVRFRV